MNKPYRMGQLTAGVLFVGLGAALLVRFFYPYSVLELVYWGWPILLILFGAEIIYFATKKGFDDNGRNLRYDLLGMMMLVLFGLVTLGLYALEETGVAAMAQESFKTQHFDVESPFFTVDDLKGITEVKVVVQQKEVTLETTDQSKIMTYSTWRNVPAQHREEAQEKIAQTMEMVRQGDTLYLFLRQPPSPLWFSDSITGGSTVVLPATLPVDVIMERGDLNINIAELHADWKMMNEHGSTHLHLEGADDLTVTAQGMGHNLSNPEAWEEVKDDESWGRVTIGKEKARLHLLTETGDIRLDLMER